VFVTFNHIESARRCLEDYRASHRRVLRYLFQPASLRYHHAPDVSTPRRLRCLCNPLLGVSPPQYRHAPDVSTASES
jgi:hypothetical protein